MEAFQVEYIFQQNIVPSWSTLDRLSVVLIELFSEPFWRKITTHPEHVSGVRHLASLHLQLNDICMEILN